MSPHFRELRFVPSKVEGLPESTEVSEVRILPDRIEFLVAEYPCAEIRIVVDFFKIAKWPRPRWLWPLLFLCGICPQWLPVADRDWFHPPAQRFFRFYTSPPITLYMPFDEPEGYGATSFAQMQEVMRLGGYNSCDLG